MNEYITINSTSSCSTTFVATSHPHNCDTIKSLSVEEALLVEFPTAPDTVMVESCTPSSNPTAAPRGKMCALFAEINRPTNEMEFDTSLAYTGETPILQNQWMHSRSSYAVVPPWKPTYKHDRLHSNEWVEAPREIGNGRDLMAIFDNETVPRTQYELLVRHQDQQDNTALAIIEARMTLKEICEDYPKFATSSSLLLVFLCEGWTPRMIWNNISAECRQSSPDDCPWGYIDEALQYEIDLLAAAEAEPGVDAEERVSETNETSTPAAEARGRKAPNWTAADDTTLSDLRSQG